MKASVVYFSASGNTKKMAECLVASMNTIEGVEAKAFSVDAVDEAFVKESACVIVGTPIYMAAEAPKVTEWIRMAMKQIGLGGKLGGAFAAAAFAHGGGSVGLQNILTLMLVGGMLTYSSGIACGAPPIHLGPVAIDGKFDEAKPFIEIYGQRMANKALELFG